MNPLTELIKKQVVCGDGAMGTLLIDRGVPLTHCFEELSLSQPDLIGGIHAEYIDAGAQIIQTNSFGANAVRLAGYGLENQIEIINRTAAELAKSVAKDKPVFVAGSVGPLGISEVEARAQDIDRENVFRQQISALLEGGADLILCETFTDADELLLALKVKQSLSSTPILCLLASPESGRLASGVTLDEALRRLVNEGADIVGINCVSGPGVAHRLLHAVSGNLPLAAYPNAGRPMYHEGRYIYESTPDYFARASSELMAQGARIIGGCCGTTPAHIRALSRALARTEVSTLPSAREVISVPAPSLETASSREPSILDLVKQGKRVVLTEFDPPKNLNLERYLKGAKALTEAGSDMLTLADNSLAILRVSNLALGIRLKNEGIPTLLHMSCRDRNVLGLQSDLMGMAAFGIRHVLPLTGDPAKVGDHPGATSVYEIKSIALIEIIKRMNEGFTQAGNPLKHAPDFVIGCTYNPNARNLEAQTSRLRRKIEAGAQYVMTQPVFDSALVKTTAELTAELNVPVFIGVWPLLNGRQATFLHNEVPGIKIPPDILARMEGKEGEEGLREGITIAKEIAQAVLDHFPGVYLMTPFQRYDTTVELCDFVRRK